MLEYLGERATGMAAHLPELPQGLDAWGKRRAEVIQKLPDVLGLPRREPMRAAVTHQKEQEGLIIEEVVYLWAERAYVSANVVRSKEATGRRPGIVVPPGWLGHYTWPCYRSFVFQMAKLGYVVLFIDDPHIGKRQAPKAGLYAVASAAGTQVMGIQVFDTLRGLDYLLARSDVDPGRIGVVGLCQGAEQAWLAGALENRFQYVVPVCGTTTYEAWARMPAFEAVDLSDPSPYVADILDDTDWHEINACIAPRPVLVCSNSGDNWWPVAGYEKVVRTMAKVYGLYRAEDRFRQIRDLRSHDMTPYIPEIAAWIEARVKSLPESNAAPSSCGEPEDPDFKMIRYMQRRIQHQAMSFPADFTTRSAWENRRQETVQWLRDTCNLESMEPGKGSVVKVSEQDGLVVQELQLSLDDRLSCPALLIHRPAGARQRCAGVVLSHNGYQCMGSPEILRAAGQLASKGYWVVVPDHASPNQASRQRVQGGGLVSFYGVADTVGLPPLALRVADDLAAFRYLAQRPEIAAEKIAAAGLGVGGIDACLAALLEPRLAGVAAVDVTTVRDWSENVAPNLVEFTRVMPYLPSILTKTDLDYLFAALAPRPLLIGRLVDGWPKAGFDQVVGTAGSVYRLYEASDALLVLDARGTTKEQEEALSEGVPRQLLAAAKALMPEPPTPGTVGTFDGLRSRDTVDSAIGLIWVVGKMDGYDQQFIDDGYRLATWSFFNDNRAGQQGRVITPLIFRKEGASYRLTGIGKTRTNDGSGRQTFPFEAVEGSDAVGEGYYFGWHTGDLAGNHNAGVVEFGDSPRELMTILTLDDQQSNQKITIGKTGRVQSQFARRYSIQAVSQRRQ